MRRKKSIIGILLSILMIINIFPIIKASAASFTPRYSLSYEDTQSKYWASGTYGVSNGFPRNWNSGYSGGNCTWYAFGRAWELLGTLPNLCTNNAGAWYNYNKNNGYYPYGSTPKLGAIACWDHYDNDTGHVAVVEEIGSDYIVCSESGWSYTNGYFSTKTRSLNDSTLGMGSSYRFLGYIYIIDVDSNPPSTPTINISVGNNNTPTTISWYSEHAKDYWIAIRYSDDSWYKSFNTADTSWTNQFTPGTYKVHVEAVNDYGRTSYGYIDFTVSQSGVSTSTTATRTSGEIEVQTTISNLSQSAQCAIAVYSSDGKLLGNSITNANNSTQSVTAYFPNYSNASYVKVFLWDSLKGMKPLTSGEKVTL